MSKELSEQFWERIKKLIKLNCTTQRELSKKLGYKESYIVSSILHKISPNAELLVKLSEYFDVSIDYLLKGFDYSGSNSNQSPDLVDNIKRQINIQNYRLEVRERNKSEDKINNLKNEINNLKNKLDEIKQLSSLQVNYDK